MKHYPLLSSWDQGQENWAFGERSLPQQAKALSPGLHATGSKQVKQRVPDMTKEGSPSSVTSGRAYSARLAETQATGRIGPTTASSTRDARGPNFPALVPNMTEEGSASFLKDGEYK